MKLKIIKNDIKQEMISIKEIISKIIEKLKKKKEYHWNFSVESNKNCTSSIITKNDWNKRHSKKI